MLFVINLAFGATVFANPKPNKEARFAEKVKSEIVKLGTGTDARVAVKLLDKTKLKGYVSQINENGFVVVEDTTKTPIEVSYPNVKQVKGNNLSKGVKIAIGVGIALVVITIIGLFTTGNRS